MAWLDGLAAHDHPNENTADHSILEDIIEKWNIMEELAGEEGVLH